MKKTIGYLLIMAIVVYIAFLVYCGFFCSDKEKLTNTQFKVPSRLVEIGPYGQDVSFMEQLGIYIINMKAKRLYFKKTKVVGFDSALLKRLVAEELNIIILKNNKKVLALYKAHQDMPPDMKCLEIINPIVLYPKTIKQLDKVRIDKRKKLIMLYYKDKTDIWDLSKKNGHSEEKK